MRQDYHDASDKEGRSNVILGKVFSRTSKPFFFFPVSRVQHTLLGITYFLTFYFKEKEKEMKRREQLTYDLCLLFFLLFSSVPWQ